MWSFPEEKQPSTTRLPADSLKPLNFPGPLRGQQTLPGTLESEAARWAPGQEAFSSLVSLQWGRERDFKNKVS